MGSVTKGLMLAMETAGFGESSEERIFFTGPWSSDDRTRHMRLQARKAAAGLMREFVARGMETESHCERVATWARRLARELGLSSERVLDIELGALLHDIGYISLASVDFHRDDTLSHADLFELRRHCELGAAILYRSPSFDARSHSCSPTMKSSAAEAIRAVRPVSPFRSTGASFIWSMRSNR